MLTLLSTCNVRRRMLLLTSTLTVFSLAALNVHYEYISDSSLQRAFAPTLTDAQRKTLLNTVRVLVDALDAAYVPYHMCGGTLLGSVLHHGLIPWDDDVDLCVMYSDRYRIREALRRTAPEYTWIEPEDQHRWKFFSALPNETATIPFKEATWRAPFVDICMCERNNRSFWDMSNEKDKRFPLSVVFPLGRRPFSGMVLRAPRNSRAYLSRNYSLRHCKTNGWSHIREAASTRTLTVRCERLRSIYPFVFNRLLPDKNRVLEALTIDDEVLSTVEVDGSGLLL